MLLLLRVVRKTALVLALSLLVLPLSAQSLHIDSASEWLAGSLEQINPYESYGRIQLQSQSGVFSDSFDQNFMKFFWTVDAPSDNPVFGQGRVQVAASGSLSGTAGVGQGLRSGYFPMSSDGDFSVSIEPTGTQSGALFLNGQPWSENYFAVVVQNAPSGFEGAKVFYNNGISVISSAGQIIDRPLRVRINKSGNTLSAYYLDNTWQLITTTAMTLSPVNYSVGLGAHRAGWLAGGSANYTHFQAGPYAAHGTWTSKVLNRGGIPQTSGNIFWEAESPAGTWLEIQTRASADGQHWDDWSAAYASSSGSPVTSPPLRYIQVRAILNSNTTGDSSPMLKSITFTQPDFEQTLLEAKNVKVLPNPIKGDNLVLDYLLAQPAAAARLQISGGQGRILYEADSGISQGRNQHTVDVRELANGVYFARLTVTSIEGVEKTVLKKIVVLR